MAAHHCPPVYICKPCSISDGTVKELSTLSYISVDLVVEQVVRLGRGALLAKLDIQCTYGIVPVHSEDRCLLQVTSSEVEGAAIYGLCIVGLR